LLEQINWSTPAFTTGSGLIVMVFVVDVEVQPVATSVKITLYEAVVGVVPVFDKVKEPVAVVIAGVVFHA
jgi:hypothetical protein